MADSYVSIKECHFPQICELGYFLLGARLKISWKEVKHLLWSFELVNIFFENVFFSKCTTLEVIEWWECSHFQKLEHSRCSLFSLQFTYSVGLLKEYFGRKLIWSEFFGLVLFSNISKHTQHEDGKKAASYISESVKVKVTDFDFWRERKKKNGKKWKTNICGYWYSSYNFLKPPSTITHPIVV